MGIIPCTIRHITLIEVTNGVRYTGGIDKDGMDLPNVQGVADYSGEQRNYFCSNCLKQFDGRESFDECKKHFGTFPIN